MGNHQHPEPEWLYKAVEMTRATTNKGVEKLSFGTVNVLERKVFPKVGSKTPWSYF